MLLCTTIFVQATELQRSGWNLISICQDMNASEIDMTNIKEVQSQNGHSIYTGEFKPYSNLNNLEAGYAYWVKGEAGTSFNRGDSLTQLVKPLKRTGWNLMASCENIPRADIDMTNIEEIQAQNGKSIYIGENAKYSNLDGFINGYGYWIKGNEVFPDFKGWQKGYAAFTYSNKDKDRLVMYVENQETHHKTRLFKDELKLLLEHHKIEFDDKYLV